MCHFRTHGWKTIKNRCCSIERWVPQMWSKPYQCVETLWAVKCPTENKKTFSHKFKYTCFVHTYVYVHLRIHMYIEQGSCAMYIYIYCIYIHTTLFIWIELNYGMYIQMNCIDHGCSLTCQKAFDLIHFISPWCTGNIIAPYFQIWWRSMLAIKSGDDLEGWKHNDLQWQSHDPHSLQCYCDAGPHIYPSIDCSDIFQVQQSVKKSSVSWKDSTFILVRVAGVSNTETMFRSFLHSWSVVSCLDILSARRGSLPFLISVAAFCSLISAGIRMLVYPSVPTSEQDAPCRLFVGYWTLRNSSSGICGKNSGIGSFCYRSCLLSRKLLDAVWAAHASQDLGEPPPFKFTRQGSHLVSLAAKATLVSLELVATLPCRDSIVFVLGRVAFVSTSTVYRHLSMVDTLATGN
jgi:hypothetical protein